MGEYLRMEEMFSTLEEGWKKYGEITYGVR